MDNDQITTWARIGAAARIAEINTEIAALVRAFPDIEQPAPPDREVRRTHINNVAQHIAQDAPPRTRKRHHTMSDEERARVSRRMRKYWRERRAASK